jgi:hypothetical protein
MAQSYTFQTLVPDLGGHIFFLSNPRGLISGSTIATISGANNENKA